MTSSSNGSIDVRRIRTTFKDYSGRLTSAQKKTLDEYNITYEFTENNRIKFIYGERAVICSGNPRDCRTGRNLGTKLVQLIEGRAITF